jgi:hypothetical protein
VNPFTAIYNWILGKRAMPEPLQSPPDVAPFEPPANATRGVRNNNPGNLDQGTAWEGLAPVQTDPRFCVFTTPEYGIRALTTVLLTYQTVHNLRTIRTMITRWAPPIENDTLAYINFVAGRVGVSPDTVIDLHDIHLSKPMVAAIIAQENANFAYPDAILAAGLGMAGVV